MAILGGMVVLGLLFEEAHVTSIRIMLLIASLVGGRKLTGLDEIVETVAIGFVGFFGRGRMTPVLNIGLTRAAGGLGRQLGGWGSERRLLDDVIGRRHDELGWIGKIFPIIRKDLVNEGLLFEVFKEWGWEGLDVVLAGVIRILDDGSVFRFFELGKEMTEAGGELLDRFSRVVAADG